MSAALTLAKQGWTVKGYFPGFDQSKNQNKLPLSISHRHSDWLKALGLWSRLKTNISSIQQLKVSYQQGLGSLHLNGDAAEKSLGFVVMSDHLEQALKTAIDETETLTVTTEAVTKLAKLDQDQWQLITANRTQQGLSHRVLLCDGARSPLAESLGIQASRSGPHWLTRSTVLSSKVKLGKPLEARQSILDQCFLGVIPYQNQAWLMVTQPKSQQFSPRAVWQALGLDPCNEDLSQQQWREVGVSQCMHREDSHHHGLLCLGQARFSYPPLGAQVLNRGWDELKILGEHIKKEPWHLVSPWSWQQSLQQAWSDKNGSWLNQNQAVLTTLMNRNGLCPPWVYSCAWSVGLVSGRLASTVKQWGGVNQGVKQSWKL